MNNRLVLVNTIRFVGLTLLQVLIFNNIGLFGYINPFIYLLFVLLLPFETPAWLSLMIGFFTGYTQDLFLNTGGIHAAATVAVTFMRPFLLRTIVSKRDFESGIKPGVQDLGWKWFLTYTGISVLIHSMLVFYIDAFRWSAFFETLRFAFYQAVATFFFIVLFEMLSTIRRRS